MAEVTPVILVSSWNTFPANCGPLSEIMRLGVPCSLNTLFMYNSAVPLASIVSLQGIKWICLVVRSPMVRMLSKPWDCGNFTIKSLAMTVHGRSGISVGFRGPMGLECDGLLLLQRSQVETYSLINLVIPGHQ